MRSTVQFIPGKGAIKCALAILVAGFPSARTATAPEPMVLSARQMAGSIQPASLGPRANPAAQASSRAGAALTRTGPDAPAVIRQNTPVQLVEPTPGWILSTRTWKTLDRFPVRPDVDLASRSPYFGIKLVFGFGG